MHPILFGYTVAFLVFHMAQVAISTPVVEYDKGLRYEEYEVEHEISSTQARNSALHTDVNYVPLPGCQPCTLEEKKYCLGSDLIYDHCCCDKRYHETLPFIPHTCYLGPILCDTIANSCGEYRRLRDCCCQKYALEKWKAKSGGTSSVPWNPTTLLIITLYFLVYHT